MQGRARVFLCLIASLATFAAARPFHGDQQQQEGVAFVSVYQTAKDDGSRISLVQSRRFERSDTDNTPRLASNDADVKDATDLFADDVGYEPVVIDIDASVTYQTITGFGGAFTQAAAITLSKMNPALQEEIIEAYYGKDGLRYNIGRVPINSCDFSIENYSCAPIADDFGLNFFNLTYADTEQIIPLVRRALKARASWAKSDANGYDQDEDDGMAGMKLFASPWSPPAWMKKNGRMDFSFRPNGLKSGSKFEATWADFFAKWLASYKTEGISFWAVTVQNEPTAPSLWESCNWSPEHERDFIKNHLGPTLQREHPNVKIIIQDDQKGLLPSFAAVILKDPEAARYVSGSGIHWYSGDQFQAVEQHAKQFPDKFILATEACEGYLPWSRGPRLGSWERGEHYAHDILGDMLAGVVGWTDWNIVLDEMGGPNHLGNYCDAPIIADTKNQIVHYQISYYALGHFSKFVPRGSVRISTVVSEPPGRKATGLETVAFLNRATSTVSVVVLNRRDEDIPYVLRNGQETFRNIIPKRGMQTLVFSV